MLPPKKALIAKKPAPAPVPAPVLPAKGRRASKKAAPAPAPVAEAPKKVPKRPPTAYSLFVKEHYASTKDIPLKERFKKMSELWSQHKQKASSGAKATATELPDKVNVEVAVPAATSK